MNIIYTIIEILISSNSCSEDSLENILDSIKVVLTTNNETLANETFNELTKYNKELKEYQSFKETELKLLQDSLGFTDKWNNSYLLQEKEIEETCTGLKGFEYIKAVNKIIQKECYNITSVEDSWKDNDWGDIKREWLQNNLFKPTVPDNSDYEYKLFKTYQN